MMILLLLFHKTEHDCLQIFLTPSWHISCFRSSSWITWILTTPLANCISLY